MPAASVIVAMTFDPVMAACEASSAAELELGVLEALQTTVGYDVGFFAYGGAEPVVVGLDQARLSRALQPGNPYEVELLPIKQAALAARGVAIDTEVLGSRAAQRTRYFKDFAAPLGGKQTLLAFLTLRGRPLGALMLGRTRATFRSVDVTAVATLLPKLSVARASFGLPSPVSRPLRGTGWPSRLRGHLKTVPLPGAEIVVRDRRGFREMAARSLDTQRELLWTKSALADPSRSGWPYIDLFHVAAALAHRRERALFIGCGGAVAPRQFARIYPGIRLDVVELEPTVVTLAREFFATDEIPSLHFHVDDGLGFVTRADPCVWDVVVVDAFDSGASAAGLASREFFAALSRCLRPGGTFAFNVIGSLEQAGPVGVVLDAARRDFPDLRVVPVVRPDEDFAPTDLRNIVVVGRKPR